MSGSRLEALGLAKHFKIGDVLQDSAGVVSTFKNLFEGKDAFYNSAALQSAQEECCARAHWRCQRFASTSAIWRNELQPNVRNARCAWMLSHRLAELVTYDDVKHASRGLVPTVAYEGCFFIGVQGGLAVSCCVVLSDTRSVIVAR